MACGAPVVAARAAALPEVGGDAAVYLDPADDAAWSTAMLDLLRDPVERERLSAAGLVRATEYSWEATARATWNVYREVAR